MILLTEPGSNTAVTARFSVAGTGVMKVAGLLVVGVDVGHGQELAGAGPADDDRAAAGAGRRDLLGQQALGLVLDHRGRW